MNDNHAPTLALGIIIGGLVSLLVVMLSGATDIPSYSEYEDECVIIAHNETLLTDPEYGEDDGMVYCPTGEVSVSQLGEVVK